MADLFRLTHTITGVTFSSEGRGSLFVLPVDAQLRLTGQSSVAGFIDVIYGDKQYCVFSVDLIARSVAVRTVAAPHARALTALVRGADDTTRLEPECSCHPD